MYRKGVAIIILNSNNQILLVNLMSFEKRFFAIPGGGIEVGESNKEAIVREVYEELGLSSDKFMIVKEAKLPISFKFSKGPRIMHGKEYIGQTKHYFLAKFLGNDSDINIKLNTLEVRKYIWANYEDLHKYLLFDGQLEATVSILNDLQFKINT